MRSAKVDEIVRQKDPALKSVVELLATGQTAGAIDLLRQQGRIREIADPQERIRTIAQNYAESPANTLIVSPDNASRRELNLAVRQELKASGAVAAEDHSFRVLVQRQDLLTVEMQSGAVATYDPRRLTGVSVYREAAHEFAVGDRIQFTAPDRSLDVANRDLAVIESSAPDGRIGARPDNNRLIEFTAAEHRHFDHGYAVTSHSAPGPHCRKGTDSRRYRRPSRPAKLALPLCLRVPRQPRSDRVHQRCRETRPSARSGNQQNLRLRNEPNRIAESGDRNQLSLLSTVKSTERVGSLITPML